MRQESGGEHLSRIGGEWPPIEGERNGVPGWQRPQNGMIGDPDARLALAHGVACTVLSIEVGGRDEFAIRCSASLASV